MRRGANTISLLILLVSLAVSACTQAIRADPSNPIKTVAVLPLVNHSENLDGPVYVRELIAAELDRHQYAVKPIAEVDRILKDEMGVTLGKQLDMATAQKLGETLGVDGVLYGSLDEFNHLMTGVYNEKRVRVRAKLVNCKTGQTVWKNGIGVKNVLAVGKAGAATTVVKGVVEAKATGDDLLPLFGEPIAAPWFQLPPIVAGKDNPEDYAKGLGAAVGEKILTTTAKVPMPIESNAAVSILLNGSWHDGNPLHQPQQVGDGKMIPPGPGK
ncbi:GNA1162 family protein [Nitrospira sp. Kam-Ns4a]